jgi:hypothetical protein
VFSQGSDYRSLRGRTLLLAVLDEAAFLRDELSASPDIECTRALLPGLATTDGMLCILSSPYRKADYLHLFNHSSTQVDGIGLRHRSLQKRINAGSLAPR